MTHTIYRATVVITHADRRIIVKCSSEVPHGVEWAVERAKRSMLANRSQYRKALK